MSPDHNRLDALRRLAKDRTSTPAEKASVRRFTKALAAQIGKHPRRSRRNGDGPAPARATRGEVAAPMGSSGLKRRSVRSRWPGGGYSEGALQAIIDLALMSVALLIVLFLENDRRTGSQTGPWRLSIQSRAASACPHF
jgi:hypothetical protein